MTELGVSHSACLISDSRVCKASNLKNSVFIIGSSSSEFKEEINIIKEVLDGFSLIGYFALLSEKEKGQDAFCDKICSKIKTSHFCIALLNDPLVLKKIEGEGKNKKRVRVPSANVYYEFGIAMGLEKPVIPIIRYDLELPFDIQHLDSKASPKHIKKT